ncbi:Estradiol 17-beta-dehydrogenase 2, partial [Ophiophagus hannah]
MEESTQDIMTMLSKLCEEDKEDLGGFVGSPDSLVIHQFHPDVSAGNRATSDGAFSISNKKSQKVSSVLVTGSDRGIGLGLVKRFLELPYPPKWVFATTLDLEGKETKELRELSCKHPNLVVLQLDVTKLESIQAAQKEVQKCVGEGGLTILYNNAGIWLFNDLQTENAKDMMSVYSVNTIGPLQMSQAFLPLLKKAARRSPCQGLSSSKAAIINMSSIAGSIELMAVWDQYQLIGYRCSKPEISVEESTQGIMTVLSNLCEEDNGTLVDYLGRRIPWIRSGDRSGSGEEVSGAALSTQMGLCYNHGPGGKRSP